MARDFEDILLQHPLLPVVELSDPNKAPPLASALAEGGIKILEITLRTDVALSAAERIAGNDDFLVGLGSLLEADQFRYAAQVGAQFVVSPGLNEDLLGVANEEKIAYLPGVFTPSEIMLARDLDYETLKFFPAYTSVGVLHYPQVASSFPTINFCLTGGVTADNFLPTMDMPGVMAVGGSWLAPKKLIEANDWTGITENARRAVTALRVHTKRKAEAQAATA